MPALSFIPADLARHRRVLVDINIEYISWVHGEMARDLGIHIDDVVGMPVADYVASVIDKICGERPPSGVFYLVEAGGEIAGMGGLRGLCSDTAEIKRLYVRPGFRGLNIGSSLLRLLMQDAARFGYGRLCLDTAPFMHSAHRLYESHGFADSAPHDGAEVPAVFRDRWRFMQRAVPELLPDARAA